MRILILGNMANDGYSVAKEMRAMGMDVDLGVNISDFGMSLPEWEDGNPSGTNPYSFAYPDIRTRWSPPEWIKYFDMLNKVPRKKARIGKAKARLNLFKLMRRYDVIEAQVPYPIYAQFSGVPYCPYDAGWVRYFPCQKGIYPWLARRAYSKAKLVMFTNPDTLGIFENLPYVDPSKLVFVPFAIDPDKYRPTNQPINDGTLRIFSPARQIWEEKGNDTMFRAFALLLDKVPNAQLTAVNWGPDVKASKQLCVDMGIADRVRWIDPVPKNELISLYNKSDIILDQFVLGSWGTAAPEAMSCGKPVLIHYNPQYIQKCFGSLPPMPNTKRADHKDLFLNMLFLAKNPNEREKIGRQSRDWVIATHHPRLVAKKHYEVLKKVCEAK